jgi:hypothetical protein
MSEQAEFARLHLLKFLGTRGRVRQLSLQWGSAKF